MPPTRLPGLDPETERSLAAGLYNETWRLIELPDRSAAQDDEMVHAAHASRYHWSRVGEAVHLARGEWLCARVYSVLGRPEPALHHARRCVEILSGAAGVEDWDMPAACEAMARANLVAGDRAAARGWVEKARNGLAQVAYREDAQPIEADLEALTAEL